MPILKEVLTLRNINLAPQDGGRPFLLDLFYCQDRRPKPVIIFSHGFKGFKDWGHFNQIAEWFAQQGFIFLKFNFSHNGTTLDNPTEFTDLHAFGENTYSQELADLDAVIHYVMRDQKEIPAWEVDAARIYLMGHSRGGALSIIKAAKDERIKKVVTWAAVNDLGRGWTEKVREQWQAKKVRFIENARTNQRMPLYLSLLEDFDRHAEELSVKNAVLAMDKPFLAIHGSDDDIPMANAIEMKQWNPSIKLEIIPGANHTFGGWHPWVAPVLPRDTQYALKYTLKLFNP